MISQKVNCAGQGGTVTDYERISSLLQSELDAFDRTDRCLMFWFLVGALVALAWVGAVLILGLE